MDEKWDSNYKNLNKLFIIWLTKKNYLLFGRWIEVVENWSERNESNTFFSCEKGKIKTEKFRKLGLRWLRVFYKFWVLLFIMKRSIFRF